MATQLETTGALERKLAMAVPVAEINRQVVERLRKLSRNVKMPGFRPGKVPMKMIEQSYGPQVHAEVLGDAVSKAFSDAVDEHKLRVAGQPRIETREGAAEHELGFTATFEVYPEVALGDPATLELERVSCQVGEAEVDKTVEILRKQRVTWAAADRAAQDGDRVTIDFVGTLDGVAFEGGSATEFPFVLGEGRMLPDFEAGVRGAGTGEKKTFPVAFPAEYGSVELAGKTAQFEVTIRKVEAPQLPQVDEAFARQLGVPDGDLARMRADIRANLEREVGQRVRSRNKAAVMEALTKLAAFELPKALVEAESRALGERAIEDLRQRGIDPKNMPPIPPDTFREQAERRVRLGLIVAEIVREHGLQAKPDQIRRQIEEFAQAYENPGEVVRHYFSDRNRLAEVEAIVVEQNVVDWALSKARVTDRALPFDELMSAG
ncbi:MAG: trigger factor [Burkholderiaceae bacterium]|jgi:trigger factor|nr:trigger factor [Burkholderiaceae bacterium]HMN64632.1 trigger factor [Burkholderiaceae bacterium]